ncbi:MAG TPA: TonB-dependent receptor, partial [Bryobacteraceae bacterium]|nr:TonB-dependent receptor [Bryobacteraceae bacterium]
MQRLALVVSLLAGTGILYSQGTDLGTIRGNVLDASGAAVPQARVLITDVGTNISTTVTTNDDGEYEAPSLRSGDYRVTVSAEGFGTLEITGVVLRPGSTARADARLDVARSAEQVVVRADAPLIQSDLPTIGSTLANQALVELPRDSRDIYSFLYLNPNITRGATEGAFKFIGAQSYGASFSVDGQRTNGGVFGEPTATQPSLETIGELTVLSNSFTAEYAGIANVRVTTRRGGSDYHGSLFYNNKNSALAAWDYRDKVALANFVPTPARSDYTKPYFNLNEFGASFGGPVPKLKNTFFFAAYERRLQNSPVVFSSRTLPHPSLWTGDFSRMTDANKPLVPANVQLTQEEIASSTVTVAGQRRFVRIPQRLMSPFTTALVRNYFPQDASASAAINATNGRLVDYYTNTPGRIRRHLGSVRVDHDISDKDRLYGVYNIQENQQATSAVVSPFSGLGLTANDRSNHLLSISETHLFAPTLINEARGGFNYQPTLRRSNQTLAAFLQNIGFSQQDIDAYGAVITPSALDTFGHPAVEFGTGFQAFTNGGRNTYRPLDQRQITFGDTLTWVTGRHTMKFGVDFVRNTAVDGFTSGRGNPRGLIRYTGAGPDAFARFLIGLPANEVRYVNQFRPPMNVRNWEHGFFAQDDFKIHPRLTLNLGLRYEIITPFTEVNDLLINFDPDYQGPNGRKGIFVVPSERTLQSVDPRYITYGVITASERGVPRPLVRTDYNNVAPRLGAAWRFTERTVLRGGYGFFYPTSAAQGIRDPLATNSFQVTLTRRNTADAPLQAWPRPMTGGTLSLLSGLISGNWVPFGLQQPRVQQFNVTLERELGWQTAVRVSYLGTRMSGLIGGVDYNTIPPSDQGFGTTTGDGVTPCTPSEGNCDISPADRARLP